MDMVQKIYISIFFYFFLKEKIALEESVKSLSHDLQKANKTILQFSKDKRGLNEIIDDQAKKLFQSEKQIKEMKYRKKEVNMSFDNDDDVTKISYYSYSLL